MEEKEEGEKEDSRREKKKLSERWWSATWQFLVGEGKIKREKEKEKGKKERKKVIRWVGIGTCIKVRLARFKFKIQELLRGSYDIFQVSKDYNLTPKYKILFQLSPQKFTFLLQIFLKFQFNLHIFDHPTPLKTLVLKMNVSIHRQQVMINTSTLLR